MKFIVFALLLLLSSCLSLDDNLFNTSEKITEYRRDNYAGDQDFRLDESYRIPDSLIHVFTLPSRTPDEENSTHIYATYVGDISRIATDTVIMYCHGNKWHMDLYWQRVKLLANTGGKNRFGVMMIDYRGYGLSEGKPSEAGLYADVNAALGWLKAKGLSESRLVMYGFSMGTAPATELTAYPGTLRPAKLILEAPFASADVMVRDGALLNLPGSFVTGLKIDVAERISHVQQPFLWLHGTNDNFLNIKTHGEVVYKNYHGQYGEARRVGGADHTTVPNTMGFPVYNETILRFLKR